MPSSSRNPLQRPPTTLATLLVALAVGLSTALVQWRQSGAQSSAPRVMVLMAAYALACAAVVVSVRLATLRPDAAVAAHFRGGLAAALVLSWTLLDLLHYRLFRRHIDAAALHLGWEAVRSKSIGVGASDLAAVVAAFGVGVVLFSLFHATLSRFGTTLRAEKAARGIAGFVLMLGLLGGLLRERLWDEDHHEAERLARSLPWASNLDVRFLDTSDSGFGADVDLGVVRELGARRDALARSTLGARSRPDLLIVHVESLRGDVLVPELMPRLVELGKECQIPRRHYATGNNTGSAVFGLMSGLSGFQYPHARQNRATVLPLVVLKKLGYRIFTHFANNLRTYWTRPSFPPTVRPTRWTAQSWRTT
ncbi:MAG: hypothetical protein IPM35_41705 [Myxococcales bacterium]|nr:hypothetical protein [Myxococcales bacterium]